MFVRFQPITDLPRFARIDRDLLSLLEWPANGRTARTGKTDDTEAARWQPAVDVHEDATRYALVLDLPGVEEKDVELSVDKGVLTLRGQRQPDARPEGQTTHRTERPSGRFLRSFTLPDSVEGDKITAELKAGVLTLTLPKRPVVQPRQIKVTKVTSA